MEGVAGAPPFVCPCAVGPPHGSCVFACRRITGFYPTSEMSTSNRPGASPSREPRRDQLNRAIAEEKLDLGLATTRSKSTVALKASLVSKGTGVKEGLQPVPASRDARPPAIVPAELQEALAKSLMPHDTSERPEIMLAPRRYPVFVSIKDGAYRVPVLPGCTGLPRLFPLAYDVGDDLAKGPTAKLANLYWQLSPAATGLRLTRMRVSSEARASS